MESRPVVASKIGGIPEQIVDGEHGVLLEDPSNLQQLGSAISRVLQDKPYAQQLGDNARARVVQESLADRHLEHYARLINQL